MSTTQNQTTFRQVITEAFNKGNYAVLYSCFNADFIERVGDQCGRAKFLKSQFGVLVYVTAQIDDFVFKGLSLV